MEAMILYFVLWSLFIQLGYKSSKPQLYAFIVSIMVIVGDTIVRILL